MKKRKMIHDAHSVAVAIKCSNSVEKLYSRCTSLYNAAHRMPKTAYHLDEQQFFSVPRAVRLTTNTATTNTPPPSHMQPLKNSAFPSASPSKNRVSTRLQLFSKILPRAPKRCCSQSFLFFSFCFILGRFSFTLDASFSPHIQHRLTLLCISAVGFVLFYQSTYLNLSLVHVLHA